MAIALHGEARRYQPLPEGIALAEVMRLFEDSHTPGSIRLVARVENESHQWMEHAVTSIGTLAMGDLLMTLGKGPIDFMPVRLDDLTALLRVSRQDGQGKLIYASSDGGATTLVCRGAYVAQRNASAAYLTFVTRDARYPQQHQRTRADGYARLSAATAAA